MEPDKFESRHPTQKPVECMLRAMRNHEIKTVYDPFLGTGTTLIAAEHEGRRCVGLELEPRWADVILERCDGWTGLRLSVLTWGSQPLLPREQLALILFGQPDVGSVCTML